MASGPEHINPDTSFNTKRTTSQSSVLKPFVILVFDDENCVESQF